MEVILFLLFIIVLIAVIWRLLAPDTLLIFGNFSIDIKVIFSSIRWFIRDSINTLRLRHYLTGFQRIIAGDNPDTVISREEAAKVKYACKYMRWSRIKRNKGKLVALIPCSQYSEIQEYIFNHINRSLKLWLNEKYPGKHWGQIELIRGKYSLIHYLSIKEK